MALARYGGSLRVVVMVVLEVGHWLKGSGPVHAGSVFCFSITWMLTSISILHRSQYTTASPELMQRAVRLPHFGQYTTVCARTRLPLPASSIRKTCSPSHHRRSGSGALPALLWETFYSLESDRYVDGDGERCDSTARNPLVD